MLLLGDLPSRARGARGTSLAAGKLAGGAGTTLDGESYNFAEIPASSLQGLVFEDFNDSGTIDLNELAIEGVRLLEKRKEPTT